MTVESLLERLDSVRRVGHGRWVARCPAHDDRKPSLSVRELNDGRVLVHCFGGCTVGDIVAAVGLDLQVLFPGRGGANHLPRERRPFDAASALTCVAFEAEIASVAADNLACGIALSDADRERLRIAALRLHAAWELARG